MTRLLKNVAIILGLGVLGSLSGTYVSQLNTAWWWTALPWVLLAVFWTLLLRDACRQTKK